MTNKHTHLLYSSAVLLALSACSDSTPTSPSDEDNAGVKETDINGGAVKGPLAFAAVKVYAFDANAIGFKGTLIGTAATNSSAAIEGLTIPETTLPPFVLEMTSVQGTTIDLTTGEFPVIHTLRTVITQSLLDKGEQIYATPLTTMAVDLAIKKLQTAGGSIDATAFETALQAAAASVISTVGFGLSADIDIFDTPPLINDTTDTASEQADVAAYRTAVEALTAVVYQMEQQAPAGGDTNTVLAELAADLADDVIDGSVDGASSGVLNTAALNIFNQDPDNLPIPGAKDNPDTGQPYTVSEIEDLLEDETADTGSTTDTTALASIDTQTQPAETNPDKDGDGVLNAADAFPLDGSETMDSDNDGMGNNADPDDDNDGVLDPDDAFPLNAAEQLDTDSDGIGDNADSDKDGDGVDNAADDYPLDATRSSVNDQDSDGWDALYDADDTDASIPGTPFLDTDGDGVPDTHDADKDNDGVENDNDAFPLDAAEQVDTDGDNIGDNADTDDDGDGVDDADDAFPKDETETLDSDRDGIGNNADTDDDNDGLSDTDEAVAGSDPLDRDSDNDGYLDGSDDFPGNPDETVDSDNDGVGDNADAFDDDPTETTDSDNDGVGDNADAFDDDPTETTDSDNDGVGDNADAFDDDPAETTDSDNDGIGNNGDNCPVNANSDQADTNNNGVGDVCESAPVANDIGSATTPIDVLVNTAKLFDVLAETTDANGDTRTITGFTQGTNGVVSESNGMLSYTSSTPGADSFTYTASDGHLSDTATVYINVASNQPPVIDDGSLTVDEDGSATTVNLVTDGVDPENDPISIKSADTMSSNGGTVVNNNDGTLTYSPAPDFNGSDVFSILATDGSNDVSVAVNVTVTPQNDVPTISGTPPTSITEGDSYSFSTNGDDVDLADSASTESLSYSIAGHPGWMSIDATTGVVSGTATELGTTDNIVITVTDSENTSASLTAFSVTVTEATTVPLQLTGVFSGTFTLNSYEMTSSSGGLDCMNSNEYTVNAAETYTSIISIDGTTETLTLISADGEFIDKGNFDPTDNSTTLNIEESWQEGTGPNDGDLGFHMAQSATGNFDQSTGILTQSWMTTITLTESNASGGATYTAVCEAQGSDTATLYASFAPMNAQLILADGFAQFENEEVPVYDFLAYVGGIATDEEHSYNASTESWDIQDLTTSSALAPILGDNGQWQTTRGDVLLDGSLSFTGDRAEWVGSVGDVVFGNSTIDVSAVSIAGLPMKDFLPESWHSRLLDPDALMPAGAMLPTTQVTHNLTQYILWDGQWDCPDEQYTLLSNSCNGVDRDRYNTETLNWDTEYLSSLDDLIQTAPYDTSTANQAGPVHVRLENALAAELLTDGTVHFYDRSVNWNQLSPMTETSTWTRSQPMVTGAEVIQFTVPDVLVADWEYPEDRHTLLSVQNGYVRSGAVFMAGETDDKLVGKLNKTAIDAITANFDLALIANVPEATIGTVPAAEGTVDMSSTPFVNWIGDDGNGSPEYAMFSPPAGETLYEWNSISFSFDEIQPENYNYGRALMTDKGWVEGTDVGELVSSTATALLAASIVKDPSAEVTARYSITFQAETSLEGQNIKTVVSDLSTDWANLINASAVFTSAATSYDVNLLLERDEYSFKLGGSDNMTTKISSSGEMSNVVDLGAVIENSSIIVLGYDESTNIGYGVRFIGGATSGTADYSSFNFGSGEMTFGLASGSWDLVRVNGEYLLRFDIPNAFAALYGDEGEYLFLTPYQDSVSIGPYVSAGAGRSDKFFNTATLDEIKAATTAP